MPEPMKMLRLKNNGEIEEEMFKTGWFYVDMPLGDVCIFIRHNYILPIAEGGEYVDEVDFDKLKIYSGGGETRPYEYYTDDGVTKEYSLEKNIRILLSGDN